MTSLPPIRTKADIISSSTALALHDPSLAPFLWHTHAGYYAPYTALSRVESMQGGMGGMGMGGMGMGGMGMGGLGMGGLGMGGLGMGGLGMGGMGMMNPMMMVSQTACPVAGFKKWRARLGVGIEAVGVG